jgi:hypothetical protein
VEVLDLISRGRSNTEIATQALMESKTDELAMNF